MRRAGEGRTVGSRRPSRRIAAWVALLLLGLGLTACAPDTSDRGDAPADIVADGVLVTSLDGAINPISERYLVRAIDDAVRGGAELVVLELNTPGGLLESTQRLTARMLGSEVPVAVLVTPPGGRAASAGVFVTMAGHVAAMAPNTRIGAATPIATDGSEIGDDLRRKILNDAVAYARAIADARGRNADWAEEAVRDAVVIDASTAVEIEVVDLIANDRADLLERIDGREIALVTGDVALATASALVTERTMSPFESLFMALADPNIALLLLSLGGLAIYFELANPGGFVPGIAGAIMLILAFFSLGTLPISYAGLALVGLGLILLGAEIFVSSGGVLGTGGVIAFGLGGFLLIDEQQAPFLEVSRPLLIGLTVSMGLFVLIVIRGMLQVRRRPAAIGRDDMLGRVAEVRGDDEVFVAGELWRASTRDGAGPLPLPGERVRIVGRRGFTLLVEPDSDQPNPVPNAGGT